VRRNYGYLFIVIIVSWSLKLEVHPDTARSWGELVGRAAVGTLPGGAVMGLLAAAIILLLALAARAPSEQMMNWADIPSPLQRWVTRSQSWGRGMVGRRPGRSDEP
jgi:uncharacterized membrane protein